MTATTAHAVAGSSPRPRFMPGTICQAREGIVPLRTRPSQFAERDTEVLFGERVTVLAHRNGWLRVRADLDGKEGFVEAKSFSSRLLRPTHRVCVPHVSVTKTRPVQSPLQFTLGMNALVQVFDTLDGRACIKHAGWVNQGCLRPIDVPETDFVEVARRFLGTGPTSGTPYVWGGRTGSGVDCSGLLQSSLLACGVRDVPRDSGPQSKVLGVPIDPDNGLARGDLVFWKGHVGIMDDATNLLNATDYGCGLAVLEPLAGVLARRRARELEGKKEITVVRRFPWYASYLLTRGS
jgi:hypothetical protein